MSQGKGPVQSGPTSISQYLPNATAHPHQSQGAWFSLFPTDVRLTGEKVARGSEEMKLNSSWRWFVFAMTCSGLKWPPEWQCSDSRRRVNYCELAFKNCSDVLGLKWFKHIEQKGKRRGNQAPLGILFESTKRLAWNLQSIYKEAVKSFIHLKGVGKRQEVGRRDQAAAWRNGEQKRQLCDVGKKAFPKTGRKLPLLVLMSWTED